MNAMNILAVCVTQAEILGSYTSLLRCYLALQEEAQEIYPILGSKPWKKSLTLLC